MEFVLGAGFGAGFLVGLEMPKLIRKKRKPLRSESARLIEMPFRDVSRISCWDGLRRFIVLESESGGLRSVLSHP